MENQQPKTGKFALQFGLILGLINVVFGVMLYVLDSHYQQNTGVTVVNIVIMLGVILWSIIAFRKANGGYLTISQALKVGVGVAAVAGVIAILYTMILSNVIDTEFANKVMDDRLANSPQTAEMTAEQIQQQKEMGVKFFWIGYPVMLIFSVLIGLVMALIGGLIFKKAKPDY